MSEYRSDNYFLSVILSVVRFANIEAVALHKLAQLSALAIGVLARRINEIVKGMRGITASCSQSKLAV